MKYMRFEKCVTFLLLVFIILIAASIAEAQRGQPMMDRQKNQQQDQMMEDRGRGIGMGPGMMGPMGMICPQMMGGQDMMGQGMGPGMMMRDLYQLDLTEKQRSEIQSIQRETRRQHMEIMLDIMDIRDDMMEAMSADRPDPEKVRGLQKSISEKQGDMLESSVEIRNKIYDLLTEEQREQLKGF